MPFQRKVPPPPSLTLVTHPETDRNYVHFEVPFADGSKQRAVTALPFDITAKGRFSFLNAWWLSEAALLSYWEGNTASARFRDQAGLRSELFEKEAIACYVASNDAFTIVAFRGTRPNEKADVWADINFIPIKWPKGGEVHEGFEEALDVVWGPLSDRLRHLPSDTVWFTGHSLGAALATLAADRFGEPAGVYTFGSPRVGTLEFVAGFDGRHKQRSFRYVNNNDVVTHVPPSAWKFGHVANEQHINSDGQIGQTQAANGASVIKETAESFARKVTAIAAGKLAITSGASILPGGLVDHTPRRYATFVWNGLVDSRLVASR